MRQWIWSTGNGLSPVLHKTVDWTWWCLAIKTNIWKILIKTLWFVYCKTIWKCHVQNNVDDVLRSCDDINHARLHLINWPHNGLVLTEQPTTATASKDQVLCLQMTPLYISSSMKTTSHTRWPVADWGRAWTRILEGNWGHGMTSSQRWYER